MKTWKVWLPDVVAVVIFALIAFAYFFPADIEGRILYQHDASAGRGAGQEASEYHQRTGEQTRCLAVCLPIRRHHRTTVPNR